MVQRGDHTRDQQHRIVGRDRRQQIAGGEDRREADQQGPARRAAGGQGHQRRAQHDAQGVGADQEAGRGNGDAQVRCDDGQQAHGRELGHADAEGAGRQRQQGRIQFHWGESTFRDFGQPGSAGVRRGAGSGGRTLPAGDRACGDRAAGHRWRRRAKRSGRASGSSRRRPGSGATVVRCGRRR